MICSRVSCQSLVLPILRYRLASALVRISSFLAMFLCPSLSELPSRLENPECHAQKVIDDVLRVRISVVLLLPVIGDGVQAEPIGHGDAAPERNTLGGDVHRRGGSGEGFPCAVIHPEAVGKAA